MTDETPHTFVLITVGALPPDVRVADAPSLMQLFSHSLVIGPQIRGSVLVVSTESDAVALLRQLAALVPSPATKLVDTPAGPKIVRPH